MLRAKLQSELKEKISHLKRLNSYERDSKVVKLEGYNVQIHTLHTNALTHTHTHIHWWKKEKCIFIYTLVEIQNETSFCFDELIHFLFYFISNHIKKGKSMKSSKSKQRMPI